MSRRDFSINAMAYNDKIGLIDPFDGISDIKNRRICCVGDPGKRIDENKASIAWVIPKIIDMVGCEQNNPYHVEDVFQHTLSAMRNMSTSNIFPAKWVDGYVRCAL